MTNYLAYYQVNTQYWTSPTGPVFLYIEGEGAGSAGDVMYGNHVEMAQQMGALLIAVEHRYYGKLPTTACLRS